MKISNVQNFQPFCNAKKAAKTDDKNPISTRGERATLLKATVGAGLYVGAEALYYLDDGGFMLESLFDYSEKKVNRNAKLSGKTPSAGKYLAAWGAVTIGFVAAVAAVYTLYKTPEIIYQGRVNAFKKGKDMDVYTKGNKVERELYEQMNVKAANANFEEKKKLAEQYLKLRAAKNQLPDFIEGENLSKLKVKKSMLEKN